MSRGGKKIFPFTDRPPPYLHSRLAHSSVAFHRNKYNLYLFEILGSRKGASRIFHPRGASCFLTLASWLYSIRFEGIRNRRSTGSFSMRFSPKRESTRTIFPAAFARAPIRNRTSIFAHLAFGSSGRRARVSFTVDRGVAP